MRFMIAYITLTTIIAIITIIIIAIITIIIVKDVESEERFHVELHFSPGAYTCGQKKKDPNSLGYRSQMKKKEV